MSEAIVTAVRARLAAALPAWRDATGAAHPTPSDDLPAYAVRVTYTDAERLGMSDARHLRAGQLEVGIEHLTPANDEAGMHDLAAQLTGHILADPADLGGLVWDIEIAGFEADHDKGESRVSRGDLIMPLQVIE